MNQDVGVLLVFFNKVNTLKEVFEAIRIAKPKKLFLAQDGPRNEVGADIDNIKKCREVVENIDWDCEVYKNYSDKNLSCDPREFTAISWAFEHVTKLIILEDDAVPNQSFFRFMDDMLQYYENDNRIQMITGIERFGENKYCTDSYYFSTINAGCAWATWRRVWQEVEKWSNYSFVERNEDRKKIDFHVKKCLPYCYHDFIKKGMANRELNKKINGIHSWEYSMATSLVLGNRICITPRVNLVKNIGVGEEATHSGSSLKTIPHKFRRIFFMETYELEFPLKHPQYMIRDSEYERAYEKVFCYNRLDYFFIKLERLWLLLIYGGVGEVTKVIKRKLRR